MARGSIGLMLVVQSIVTSLIPAQRVLAQPIAVGEQSALRTGGVEAARIAALWDRLLLISTIVTLLVLATLAWAIWRRRDPGERPEADRPADARGELHNEEGGGRGHEESGRPRSERIGVRVMVIGGIVVPALVLAVVLVDVLLALDVVSLPARAVPDLDAVPKAGEVAIRVTGRQYWWEIEYLDADPQRRFRTANELHIPVGERVVVRLASGDVIHSFWVPSLQGKMDLVPGRENALAITAERPGTYRGQCAEFCGVQHAMMAFVVVAESRADFEGWAAGQRLPAVAARDSGVAADRAVFEGSGCVLCHTVRGTSARGELGPDLTHVASRLTLAAGTLPNAPGHLAGWVANPQALKPGSRMPAVPLDARSLHAVLRYLSTLR